MVVGDTASQPKPKKTPSSVFQAIIAPRGQIATGSASTNSSQVPLGEIHHNLERPGPSSRSSSQVIMDKTKLLHKRSKSEFRTVVQDKSKSEITSTSKVPPPKKTKSSTNLAAFLSRGTSKTKDIQSEDKNKENQPPIPVENITTPPIWAQFSSQPVDQDAQVVLGKARDSPGYLERSASPIKKHVGTSSIQEPLASSQHTGIKVPLKAAAEDRIESSSRAFGILRKTSISKSSRDKNDNKIRGRDSKPVPRPPTSDGTASKITGTSRGQSRVRAAVAAISGKAKDPAPVSVSKPSTPVDIEKEFEAMLEARNIAPEVRDKMRALDKTIKADLIKQNNATPVQPDSGSTGSRTSSRPANRSRTNTTESVVSVKQDVLGTNEKKPRPRSFTGFTLSKGAPSPKKQKQGKTSNHSRGKSAELPRSTSTTSLVSVASASSFNLFGKTPKLTQPEDFIAYLKTHTKPQDVEVGKIQKLRQLLRNETVSWVNEFIAEGGMIELVDLVYRIIDIEWREEHEDNLFHHTLTCLKALTTTSAAMQQLETLEAKLIPRLLTLLFSSGEEKKGPAEFTTRGLIISLLMASITASPTPDRARSLLSYLKDPAPKESRVGFIADMHRPRPYKLWYTEVSNVSKEVFWIFLHSVNIIEYPSQIPEHVPYNVAHFPTPRPPVPAAPYVGSVEWDATIYLATHLDLLNGIIASLATAEERNQVRAELRDSGFEKVMGGTLRLCKEKFYGHVHAGLSTWAGAARADDWDSKDIREGPSKESNKRLRSASPKKADKAPVLAMPKLDFSEDTPLSPMLADNSKIDAWL